MKNKTEAFLDEMYNEISPVYEPDILLEGFTDAEKAKYYENLQRFNFVNTFISVLPHLRPYIKYLLRETGQESREVGADQS